MAWQDQNFRKFKVQDAAQLSSGPNTLRHFSSKQHDCLESTMPLVGLKLVALWRFPMQDGLVYEFEPTSDPG